MRYEEPNMRFIMLEDVDTLLVSVGQSTDSDNLSGGSTDVDKDGNWN